MLRLPRNSNLAKPSRGRANGPVSEPVPHPLRDRSEPASVQASQPRWFAHCPKAQVTHSANVFCILPSPSSQRVDAAPCESAAPATKSILDLAKVLRLPRNLYLTLRKCCACHAIQTLGSLRAAVPMGPSPNPFRDRSETVPRPFRDRSETADRLRTGVAAEVVCALSGSPIHAQRQRFLHLAIPQLAESACESAAPATKSILDLAKVLRLPRNLYLTLRKCCACHAIQSLRNLRAAVWARLRTRSETVPRPFRDRSETAAVQASQPRWFAHSPEAQFTHSANVFCILPSPSSQRVLAKVLRLPRNLYLRKLSTC